MKRKSKTDFARLDRMEDKDIDLSDIPEVSAASFRKGRIRNVGRPRKGRSVRAVYSVRLEPELARRAIRRYGDITTAIETSLRLSLA